MKMDAIIANEPRIIAIVKKNPTRSGSEWFFTNAKSYRALIKAALIP
jgi:hypothetical protein